MNDRFAPTCLSIDLEVGKKDGKIHEFAAVRGDTGAVLHCAGSELASRLDRLTDFAEGASFLLCHNIVAFDLPILRAHFPSLPLLNLAVVDTLRLNPLCFPRNPYHHLVKHYQSGQLHCQQKNDPVQDAKLVLELFREQHQELCKLSTTLPDLLTAWHGLLTREAQDSALNSFFFTIRKQPRPDAVQTRRAMAHFMSGLVCSTRLCSLIEGNFSKPDLAWPIAYALSWLSVAGGNSVVPPWVLHQFPDVARLIAELRDRGCDDPACAWCVEHHNPLRVLKDWFGFDEFRSEPADAQGQPLQRAIVAAAMRGEHVLGILPTGTGKSVCYQVPALSRYRNTGALTLVISPLQALMADQVAGLQKRGISQCETLNGMLSMPERAEVLDKVRLGDCGILIVSPEQLRNKSFRDAIRQRQIGAWVMDEAHCLSKWGHDFRPDYRYVGRFIREQAGDRPIPPILCLTATAKPEVIAEIVSYFRDKLNVELQTFEGGHERRNLGFSVMPASASSKLAQVHQVLQQHLPAGSEGGAIVYASTRRNVEEIAEYLKIQGWEAGHFHAGLTPTVKKNMQEAFIDSQLKVIAATNAFGMGIDKPNVRLVIHADIPGSLENYLQEAGRAGRDQQQAHCVLLYTPEDVERQFGMTAHSRLSQKDINAVLRAIRNVEKKNRRHTDLREVVATPGEILAEDTGEFERDQATDDTRVKTAVAWMEEAELLQRQENRVSILPSSLKVASLPEAKRIIDAKVSQPARRKALLDLIDGLFQADVDEGISVDALMLSARLSSEEIRAALHDLDAMGILSNDSALTAFVDQGIARASQERLLEASALEIALIEQMRLLAPDLQPGEISQLYLSQAAQHLKDAGHAQAHPIRIQRLLSSLARDGAGDESTGGGSLELLRSHSRDILPLRLKRPWQTLASLAEKRRTAAQHLLAHLLSKLPAGARGADLLVQTTQGQLMQAIKSDLTLQTNDPSRLLTRGLMWLHEQEIIRLNKGLTVFRSAMTLQLAPGATRFKEQDYKPLRFHYDEQTFQIHVILEYAELGLKTVTDALNLVAGYFTLGKDAFIDRYLPNRTADLKRQTTPQSWERIVESLRNKAQKHIVANDREDQNILVLAGPGAGKTRVLVHRLAYLIRCRRENPHGIIALAYNRHTAADIRRRLWDLIGGNAAGVTILTCHALAMRMVGASFAERAAGQADFNEVIDEAIRLLQGGDSTPESNETAAEEQRERLLAGYRWLLVDEYQDVDARQYALISALAGRTLQDPDRKLNLLAVGDDDQNIYAWNGASVEFIRRFQADYSAHSAFLIENYRSSAHIIEAANRVIEKCAQRMKIDKRITLNRARNKEQAGGIWEKLDPEMSQGRVQILQCDNDLLYQAHAVMTELTRLSTLDKDWDWSKTAVIARRWDSLQPLCAWCELHGIPVQMGNLEGINFWRLRETQTLLDWLDRIPSKLIDADNLKPWQAKAPQGVWWDTLKSALDDYQEEIGSAAMPIAHLKDWLVDFGRSLRRTQKGLLLTSAHSAKGLEFDHVAILDDEWSHRSAKEDPDAPRRLFYVAMTRARKTLLLSRMVNRLHPFLADLSGSSCCFERSAARTPLPDGLDLFYTFSTAVDLGYAGHQDANQAIHATIDGLTVGDALSLVEAGNQWLLLNAAGLQVGRMSKKFSPPANRTFVRGKVGAILRHSKAQTDPAWHHVLRCDQWEVVMPEWVFQ